MHQALKGSNLATEELEIVTKDRDTVLVLGQILKNSSDWTRNTSFLNDTSGCGFYPTLCGNGSGGLFSNDSFSGVAEVEEAPEKVYWALLLVLLPFLAVFGNILVILSVYRERSLQTVTNYFIVSLAFADLLVSAVVMPFAVYVLVNVDWDLSDTLCDFYIAVDVTCSTASIFNLVAISIDRFIAVTQPIKYSKHKNNKRVALTIGIVWFVSAAIGSPIVLGLNTSPERIPQLCIFYNSDFIIYSSLSSFYIPCLVMVFLYYRIFKAIHDRAKKAAAKKAHTTNLRRGLVIENSAQTEKLQETPLHTSSSTTGVTSSTTMSKQGLTLPVVAEAELVTATGSGSQGDEDDDQELTEDKGGRSPDGDDCHIIQNKETEDFILTEPSKVEDGVNGSTDCAATKMEETQFCLKNLNTSSPCKTNPSAIAKWNGTANQTSCDAFVDSPPKKKPKFNLGRKHKSSRKKRERASAKRERKATKTLAIVLGVFLVCWVPFFTCNIMDAICIKLQSGECRVGMTAFLLTTWLGYMNSCVNPVIYTIYNTEFRKAFKKLLMEHCK